MKRKKILLFGGTGLLGSRIIQLLSKQYNIIAPNRNQVDLVKHTQVSSFIKNHDYDFIVYAAGEANQDRAEENKKNALHLNKTVVDAIAEIAAKKNIPLIYFSTDAVFDGTQKDRPYKETDPKNPVNYYGLTKSEGEDVVLKAGKQNSVLRLISLYTAEYTKKIDFVRNTLLRLSRNEESFGILDQFANPTLSDNAVFSLSKVLEKNTAGIYHIGATDFLSNYDFVKLIAKRFNYDQSLIIPISFAHFSKQKKTKRAQFARLDTTKTQKILGDVLSSINKSIEAFYMQVKK